ncbi:Uma2 family endonuclease [Streptomyces sp. NPDC093600]|uniref:Uma2 family endonuclease n=1 Tax=Streptomyces sp. NPDC093600 TaxID=3366047 RepID=UPI003810E5C3
MSALAVEPGPSSGPVWDELVRIREGTGVPEGWTVEIIEGIITVAPTPTWEHSDTVDEVQRVLYAVIPRDWGIYHSVSVTVPERRGLYVPDLVVIPKTAPRDAQGHVPGGEAQLVVEVTARWNANHDRVEKLQGYATAGVPFYLLLDRWHVGRPTATLYGEPRSGMYRVLAVGQFGEEIHIPAPFDLTLDTSTFPIG